MTKDDLFGTMVPPSPSFLMEKGTNARSDFEPDEFLVDLGSTREGERHRVRIGDMVVFDSPLRVHGDELVGGSLDNRVACWIILRAIQILTNTPHEIYCVFTAQEEVGLRGAGPAAFEIQPDVAIVIDMMLAPDHTGAGSHSTAPKLGHGPVLSVMDGGSISDIQILSAIESIAKLNGIPHQRSIMMCGGTDSAAIQRSGGGVRTVSIACATRYLHTPTEMVSRRDIEACRDLLAAIISSPISDAWKSGSGGPS
jgi:endoglucanase